jgi:lysozyme
MPHSFPYHCNVPTKRQRQKYLRWFFLISFFSGGLFVSYLVYLWWANREPAFVTYEEFGIPIPDQYEIHGIDVSRYQSTISWKLVKAMQVNNIKLGFAFIKATEGVDNFDPQFKRNWKKSKEAGMIRGAYHFFIASKDGKLQVNNFAKYVQLETGDLPPVVDIEDTYGMPGEKVRTELLKCLQTMEAAYGVKPIIYTYITFYNKYLKGSFDDYPLWIAHYLQPNNPRIEREWTFWQHSESGRVNGIVTKVDFNVFNGDSIAFRSLLVP